MIGIGVPVSVHCTAMMTVFTLYVSKSPVCSTRALSQKYRKEGELVWDKVSTHRCRVHSVSRGRGRRRGRESAV